jgi:hypothetical protein
MKVLVDLGNVRALTGCCYVFGEVADGATAIVCAGLLTPRTADGIPCELICD